METIVVIPRSALFAGAWPQGFLPAGAPAVADAAGAVAGAGFLVERARAECNPAWKQPIPYCLVARGEELFCVERSPRQGEDRLHGRLSIGLGGHIGPGDLGDPAGPVLAALARELGEEIALPPRLPPPRLLGLLNDDSEEVGRVHFGLVFGQIVPPGTPVQIVERSKMRGGFRHLVGPDGLWQDLPRFESWSRILLEAGAAEALLSSSRPATRTEQRKSQRNLSNG